MKAKSPGQSAPQAAVDFGYKTSWWAFWCMDVDALVEALQLHDPISVPWQEGYQRSLKEGFFLTPDHNGWRLLCGDLPPSGGDPGNETVKHLKSISKAVGQAQVFATHRVVDYHVWAKAVLGKLVRGFGYLGESGQILWSEGAVTPQEQKLGLDVLEPSFEFPTKSANKRLTLPDESHVIRLAGLWSVDPSKLSKQFKNRSNGLWGNWCRLSTKPRPKRPIAAPGPRPVDPHDIARERINDASKTGTTWLDLGDLKLAELPREIEQLNHLQMLSLALKIVVGESGQPVIVGDVSRQPLEVTDFSLLAALKSLRVLDLEGCRIRDVDPLARLPKLERLSLRFCRHVSLKGMKRLKCLRHLDLGGCDTMTNLDGLRGMVGLKELRFEWCEKLTSIEGLQDCTQLTDLWLHRGECLTDLTALSSLKSLDSLALTMCDELRDLSPISKLPKLRELDLGTSGGEFDLAQVAKLKQLKRLDLYMCEGIRRLSPLKPLLPQLEMLVLGFNKFEDVPASVYSTPHDDGMTDEEERKLSREESDERFRQTYNMIEEIQRFFKVT